MARICFIAGKVLLDFFVAHFKPAVIGIEPFDPLDIRRDPGRRNMETARDTPRETDRSIEAPAQK